MKKSIIISGGQIEDDFVLRFLKNHEQDYLIAADRGLLFFKKHGIVPTHIVGDFDSVRKPEQSKSVSAVPEASLNQESRKGSYAPEIENLLTEYEENPKVQIRRFQPEKDWTDTEIAVEQALELGCEQIHILGAFGTRIDHVLGNIQVLNLALERGADCRLVDPHNLIFMRNKSFRISKAFQFGKYISLFAFGGDVTGLTLRGFKYNVENFTLGTIGSRGVSNEILEETAEVCFDAGKILVVESVD